MTIRDFVFARFRNDYESTLVCGTLYCINQVEQCRHCAVHMQEKSGFC